MRKKDRRENVSAARIKRKWKEKERLMYFRLQRIDLWPEMERGKEEGQRPKEKLSVNESKSEHSHAGGPPLIGRAVCLALPAGPGRPLA